jgi:hypothetical protein
MNEAKEQLDKFQKHNFENNPDLLPPDYPKPLKAKYEDFFTLAHIKKTQTNCLKKIMHVPTLTMYLLYESLIDLSIDKADLQDWIAKCNASAAQRTSQSSVCPQRIVELYWNIPEHYYSIVYEYADGVLFSDILESTGILPLSFIQTMALSHLKADILIYNSILFIKRNPESDICYLPVY